MGTLRLILSLIVFGSHTGMKVILPPSSWAVECFFAISGFYIAMILSETYNTRESVRVFYYNRFLRLFPIYWAVLSVSVCYYLATALITSSGPLYFIWTKLSAEGAIYAAASNLLLFGQDLSLFLGVDGRTFFTPDFQTVAQPMYQAMIVPPAWSLSLEMAFYFFAPLLARWESRKLIFLIMSSLALRALLVVQGLSNDPWSYRFFPCELAFFVAGMLSYQFSRSMAAKAILERSVWIAGTFAALTLLGSMTFPYGKNGLTDLGNGVWASLLLLLILALPAIFHLSKKAAWDRKLGELSYPIYLVHWLVLDIFNKIWRWPGKTPLTVVSVVVLSVGLKRFSERFETRRAALRGSIAAEKSPVTPP